MVKHPDKKLADTMAADGGLGNSTRFYDTSPRLPSDGNGDWYDAFHALDESGDKTALLSLLRSRKRMDSIVREHLADLITRHEFGKPHGRPRTPSYFVASEREHQIAIAVENVWSMVRHPKNPVPYKKAVEKEAKRMVQGEKSEKRDVAAQIHEMYDTLDNACQKRRGSARRAQNRGASRLPKNY